MLVVLPHPYPGDFCADGTHVGPHHTATTSFCGWFRPYRLWRASMK